MNGIRAFIRDPTVFLPFPMLLSIVRTQQKAGSLPQGRVFSLELDQIGTLILDFQPPEV